MLEFGENLDASCLYSFIDTSLSKLVDMFAELSNRLGELIRPKCITILYCNLTLFIDIFHFKVLFWLVLHSLQLSSAEAAEAGFSGEKWTSSC